MRSNPEVFWGIVPGLPELSLEIQAMRSIILPLIILALLWLSSKLITSINGKILFKFVSWMTTFSLMVNLILIFLHGAKFIDLNTLGTLELISISLLLINPLFAHIIIFPEYKKKYTNATFFISRIWSILSYVVYLGVIGIIVFIPSLHYVAW